MGKKPSFLFPANYDITGCASKTHQPKVVGIKILTNSESTSTTSSESTSASSRKDSGVEIGSNWIGEVPVSELSVGGTSGLFTLTGSSSSDSLREVLDGSWVVVHSERQKKRRMWIFGLQKVQLSSALTSSAIYALQWRGFRLKT